MPKFSDSLTVTWHKRIRQAREWQGDVVGSVFIALQIRKGFCENDQWLTLKHIYPFSHIHTIHFAGPNSRAV